MGENIYEQKVITWNEAAFIAKRLREQYSFGSRSLVLQLRTPRGVAKFFEPDDIERAQRLERIILEWTVSARRAQSRRLGAEARE
jgi:hypothetical protein